MISWAGQVRSRNCRASVTDSDTNSAPLWTGITSEIVHPVSFALPFRYVLGLRWGDTSGPGSSPPVSGCQAAPSRASVAPRGVLVAGSPTVS